MQRALPRHLRSFALYLKLDFQARELLVLTGGEPSRAALADAMFG